MFGLLGDVLKVVTAPVRILEPIVRVVTEPVADAVEEVVKSIEDATK